MKPYRGKTSVEKRQSLSCVQLFVTPWTVAHQAPLSMGFFRQEYWNGLPFPSPGDIPNPRIEHRSSALQADSLPSEPPGKPKAKFRGGPSGLLFHNHHLTDCPQLSPCSWASSRWRGMGAPGPQRAPGAAHINSWAPSLSSLHEKSQDFILFSLGWTTRPYLR